MSKRAWIIFVVIVVIVLGGLIYLSTRSRIDVSGVNQAVVQPATAQSGNIADSVFGNKNSPVLLIEYGDYQCPGCATIYRNLKIISTKYKDQMGFVFRNFPLTSIHPNSRAAASTAEAAGLQGKFWQMHDKIYENQQSWQGASFSDRSTLFEGYARDIALNIEKYNEDLASSRIAQKINFDLALGKAAGVTGTPSLFIGKEKVNDKIIQDAISGSGKELDKLIAEKLTAAGIDLPKEEPSEE